MKEQCVSGTFVSAAHRPAAHRPAARQTGIQPTNAMQELQRLAGNVAVRQLIESPMGQRAQRVAEHRAPRGHLPFLPALQRTVGNRAMTGVLDPAARVRGNVTQPATTSAPVVAVVNDTVQRQAPKTGAAGDKADRTTRSFVDKLVEKIDDEEGDKLFLSLVLNGIKRQPKEFAALLVAKTHPDHGNYFTGMVRILEDDFGSRIAMGMLELLARNGVDVQVATRAPSLTPLAVVAKFKALMVTYNEMREQGRISPEDQQRVNTAAAAVASVLRPIEAKRSKKGPQVQLAGGAAVAAGVLWRTTAVLAADDVTGVGVADDVLIPFVVVGALVLSGIALLTSSVPPEILDYAPAQGAAKAAVALMQQVVARPVPIVPPMPPPMPPTELGKNQDKSPKPQKDATPRPNKTPQPLEPPGDGKRRKYPFGMRFQVQWDTNGDGPTFSQPAVAERDPGVTVADALAALEIAVAKTTPEKARDAAAPAAAKQVKWIQARPPSGISEANWSRSEYFKYKKYTDARVDVENMIGHNLRV